MSGSGIGGSSGGGGGGGDVVGDWVVIETQTVSSSVASVDFTSAIDSTYDYYMVEWTGVNSDTDNVSLRMRVSTDNGSTWVAGANYGVALGGFTMTSAVWSAIANGVNLGYMQLSDSVHDSGADRPCFGSLTIDEITPSTARTTASGWCATSDSTGRCNKYSFVCNRWTTEAHDAIQFLFSSGNITAGTFVLKGLKKS